ncbi:DUF6533 domain-containing protein [Sporobolomyces salmoneus]|uniref:DUF6533 domain-containing protein n=1 Tax=Sporobolomyces salmoneus TaxID=183962 RepID=UPI003180060A
MALESPPGGAPSGGMPLFLLSPPPIPGIQQFKHDLTAQNDYTVVMTAMMIWDVISTFPSEYRFVWKIKGWTYLKNVFLFNRYASLVLQILNMSLVVSDVSTHFCEHFFWFSPFVNTFVSTVCGTIFALHVWKLYGRDRQLLGIFAGCLLALVATMSATASQFTYLDFEPDVEQYLNFQGCIVDRKRGKSIAPSIVFWAAPFLFNLLVLSFAIYHSITARMVGSKRMPVFKAFVRDGIWYISVSTLVNLVSVILSAQTTNSNLHNFNSPAAIALQFIMSNRLLLRKFRHQHSPANTTLSSTSNPRHTGFNPGTYASNNNHNFAVNTIGGGQGPAIVSIQYGGTGGRPTTGNRTRPGTRDGQRLGGGGPGSRPPTRGRQPTISDDDELEDELDEKFDKTLGDVESACSTNVVGVGLGIEMERDLSETTLNEDDDEEDKRSVSSKVSNVTFEITQQGGGSPQRPQRQHQREVTGGGLEEEIENLDSDPSPSEAQGSSKPEQA